MTTLHIDGTFNVRDVADAGPGWYGKQLRPGVLLRTASLSHLSDDGVATLAELGVTRVLDLRTDEERRRDGADRVPAGTVVEPLSFNPDGQLVKDQASADPAELARRIAEAGGGQDVGRQWMMSVYRGFVREPEAQRSTALGLRVLAENTGATIVHCSAGKDRTGWFTAVVLYICGLSEPDILADYLLSRAVASQLMALIPAIAGVPKDALAPMSGVEPEYLSATLAEVEQGFGSLEGYLDHIGIDRECRQEIAGRFDLKTP